MMRTFSYTTDAPAQTNEVVDLVPYVPPVQRLMQWYDRLVDPDQTMPDIHELDEIVQNLQALPSLPGQIGGDLHLVINASEDVIRADIIDAIARLRRLANLSLDHITQHQTERYSKPPIAEER